MTKSEQYVLECINRWVWAGFYSIPEIEIMIDDVVDDDCDVAFLKASVKPEAERKLKAEAGWAAKTDCDRLDAVYYKLHEVGICALANAGYTMSDGYSDVAEVAASAPKGHYHGFCFYHGQDVERAIEGGGVTIAFGDLKDNPVAGVKVGDTIVAALRKAGFTVDWDGTLKTRIIIPNFRWQRRYKVSV